MNFQKRRIRNRPIKNFLDAKPKRKTTFLTGLGITIISLFFIFSFVNFLSNISFSSFFGVFSGIVGQSLQTDLDGHTNFLMVGTGDIMHQGRDLTDSILVASLNEKKELVTLLSVPRDLYIENDYVSGIRINGVYENIKNKENSEQGLQVLKKTVSEIIGKEIHYVVKVDFRGFEQIIDELGGIDVYLENELDDPFYPDDDTYGYEPFYLSAGHHRLDGETALKFVRSRHTSSDFARSERQQQLLQAVKERAASVGLLSSPRLMKRLYFSLEEHMETDLSVREMISLAGLAEDFSQENVYTYTIHDDHTRQGGFLYTPVRELYGGAFVLLPAGDSFELLHEYFGLIFNYSDILAQETPIQILNGTKKVGMISEMKMMLQRFGFNVVRFGNARNNEIEKSHIYIKSPDQEPAVAEILSDLLGIETSIVVPPQYLEAPYVSDASIIIEFGEDFTETFIKYNVFNALIPYDAPEASEASETSEAEKNTQ